MANEIFEATIDLVDNNQDIIDDVGDILSAIQNGELSHDDMVHQFHYIRAALSNVTDDTVKKLCIK